MTAFMTWLENQLAENSIFTLQTLSYYGDGLTTTVQLVFLSLVIGLIAAVPLAIGRGSKHAWIKWPIFAYTYVFRGTPLLIQLYLIYYGVVFVDGIQDTWLWVILEKPFVPALIAFTLNTAAYTTEIFRGAIKSTSKVKLKRLVPTACHPSRPCDALLSPALFVAPCRPTATKSFSCSMPALLPAW